MVGLEEMVDGALVAWLGANGEVRGVVDTLPGGERALTLRDGRHMELEAIAGSPSSRILGYFTKKNENNNNTK